MINLSWEAQGWLCPLFVNIQETQKEFEEFSNQSWWSPRASSIDARSNHNHQASQVSLTRLWHKYQPKQAEMLRGGCDVNIWTLCTLASGTNLWTIWGIMWYFLLGPMTQREAQYLYQGRAWWCQLQMVIHLVMPSLYSALDGDTPVDAISLISSFRWWYTWWWWAARSRCGQWSASPCPHYARCQGRACKFDLIRYKVLLAASVVVCNWKGRHTTSNSKTSPSPGV